MVSGERFRNQIAHFIETIFEWAAKARLKAAFGFGGSIKARAKTPLPSRRDFCEQRLDM
jgi:hypothetical protein